MRATRYALPVIAAAAALLLAGCDPLPGESPTAASSGTTATPSATASASTSASASAGQTATPTPTSSASAQFGVPSSCEQIYSASMLDTLALSNPPLNDPSITIYATENVPALEVLESGIPTLRCSWGQGGGAGLVTNVSEVTAEQSTQLLQAFEDAGMTCGELAGGTVCRVASETIDRQDNVARVGETHYLRGTGWIATHWVNFSPEGYTEDIVATLWP